MTAPTKKGRAVKPPAPFQHAGNAVETLAITIDIYSIPVPAKPEMLQRIMRGCQQYNKQEGKEKGGR